MTKLRLLLLLSPAVAGCAKTDSAPATGGPVTIESAKYARALDVNIAASTRTPTGLFYRDLVVGTGPEVSTGQLAAVHYAGFLIDGTPFDSSGPADPPLTFQVGAGRVIPGWEQGVVGMRVGGKRQLIIPSELGYGAAGNGPIPPNAIMVFTVELVGVQ